MKSFTRSLAAAIVAISAMGVAQASAGEIDANSYNASLSVLYGTPTTASLAAGTYQITYGYTGAAGQYQAWNFASSNYGTPQQAAAANDWTDAFSYIVNGTAGGSSSVTFNGSTIYTGTPIQAGLPGAFTTYSSAATALAGYAAALPLDTFTLAAASNVTFYTPDGGYSTDNTGGITLDVNSINTTAVPEPASMALLGAGLFGIGMIRRRRTAPQGIVA